MIVRKGVANGVINVPPRDFEVPSERYYKEQGVRKGEFGEITHGITSIHNFINFRPAILWEQIRTDGHQL
jgi:hypothetical protein